MSDDRVEINLDNDDAEPGAFSTPQAGAPAGGKSRLVITADDLANAPEPPRRPLVVAANPGNPYPENPSPGVVWPAWSGAMAYGAKPTTGIYSMNGANVRRAAIFGLIGGLLAWGIGEPFEQGRTGDSPMQLMIESAVWMAIVGGVMSCWLGAVEKLVDRLWEKAALGAAIGAAIGAGGGFIAGFFAQFVFGSLLDASDDPGIGTVMMARIIGWALVGLFTGLAQGAGRGGGQRLLNGLIGGGIGGGIGGLLFDPIGILTGGDILSRGAGIVAMCVATAAAIAMVDEMRKEAWLSVVEGPLAGKQFILYEKRTRIGASPKCEITLVKDPHLMPEHAVIEEAGANRVLHAARPDVPPYVNGQPANGARLQTGVIITVGSTHLLYEEKALLPKPY